MKAILSSMITLKIIWVTVEHMLCFDWLGLVHTLKQFTNVFIEYM